MRKRHIVALLAALAVCPAVAQETSRQPTLDAGGKFWIFKDASKPLPFIPYGLMPEGYSKLVTTDIKCKENPHAMPGETLTADATCIKVTVTKWQEPWWCGCAFLSGDPNPPEKAWWGEDNKRGVHYDLRALKAKKLVFFARGQQGGERICVKLGVLGPEKPFGDSLPYPVETEWLSLTKTWQRYELDFSRRSPATLRAICSGFCWTTARDRQTNAEPPVFFFDDIYLE